MEVVGARFTVGLLGVSAAGIPAPSAAAPVPAGRRRRARSARGWCRSSQRAEARPASARASTGAPSASADARGPFEALPHRVGPEPLFGAIGPAGGRRRRLHALAQQADAGVAAGAPACASPAARARARVETTNSSGVLSLAGCGCQASGRSHQFAIDRGRVAVAVGKAARQAIDQRGRRFVGDEVARQLGGDEARCRRMARQVAQQFASTPAAPSS